MQPTKDFMSERITEEQLKELEEKAKAASGGPLKVERLDYRSTRVLQVISTMEPMQDLVCTITVDWPEQIGQENEEDWDWAQRNATYIAATDRETILSLISDLREARQLADKWCDQAQKLAQQNRVQQRALEMAIIDLRDNEMPQTHKRLSQLDLYLLQAQRELEGE